MNLHREAWLALKRVSRGEAPGSPELREVLMRQGLIQWADGKTKPVLTVKGERLLATV